MSFWRSVRTGYVQLAILLLTTMLLFLLINLAVLPFINKTNRKPNPVVARYGEQVYAAFPHRTRLQVDSLFNEAYPYPNFRYEPYTQFNEIPRHGRYVNVSANGYRINRPQGPWPIDTTFFNVFVFGGSTTFGYGVPDNATIPARIQAHLTIRSQGKPPRIYNFGRGYYFSAQERVLFETLVHQGHIPDLVIFIDGVNDIAFWQTHMGQPFFSRNLRGLFAQMGSTGLWSLEMPLTHYLKQRARESRAIKAISSSQSSLLQGNHEAQPHIVRSALSQQAPAEGQRVRPEAPAQAMDWEAMADAYFRNKRMTQALADAFGIETLFVWQPSATYRYNYKAYHVLGSMMPATSGTATPYRLIEEQMQNTPRDARLLLLSGIQERETQNLYVDAIHYNDYFCNAIALRVVHYYLTHLAPERLAPEFRPTPGGSP